MAQAASPWLPTLFRRAATACVAGCALTLLPMACTTNTTTGVGTQDTVSITDTLGSQPDTAKLLDAILGTDGEGGDTAGVADTTEPGTEDTVSVDEGPGLEDVAVVEDEGPGPEDVVEDEGPGPEDVAVLEDEGSEPEEDVLVMVDAGSADISITVDAVEGDVVLADAGGGEEPSCLQPNGIMCADEIDCQQEDKGGIICIDGECNEQDLTPNEAAQACCEALYAEGIFGADGCTPWGPPAPPIDRGYRLAEMTNELGTLEVA